METLHYRCDGLKIAVLVISLLFVAHQTVSVSLGKSRGFVI
jgi:hypothetical protein